MACEAEFETNYLSSIVQDNVFVTVVASIQYRALADKAGDAFYKLSNTRTQIQAYVFDGMISVHTYIFLFAACNFSYKYAYALFVFFYPATKSIFLFSN